MFANGDQGGSEAAEATRTARHCRAFHWPFEYPEVFESGGFSAFVGNPPFVGGKRIREALGSGYLAYLKGRWPNRGATTDLCAYFFRRGFDLLGNPARLAWLQQTPSLRAIHGKLA